jgi:hypothetical protein
MSFRYSNVAIARKVREQTEFLKCSHLQPVTHYNPAPCWTANFSEAEVLCGTAQQLRMLAQRYGGTPVVQYGSRGECWLHDRADSDARQFAECPLSLNAL